MTGKGAAVFTLFREARKCLSEQLSRARLLCIPPRKTLAEPTGLPFSSDTLLQQGIPRPGQAQLSRK